MGERETNVFAGRRTEREERISREEQREHLMVSSPTTVKGIALLCLPCHTAVPTQRREFQPSAQRSPCRLDAGAVAGQGSSDSMYAPMIAALAALQDLWFVGRRSQARQVSISILDFWRLSFRRKRSHRSWQQAATVCCFTANG